MRVILNRIYVLHTAGMDGKQREEYDAELYSWADKEADALAAVLAGLDDEEGTGD